MNRPIRFLLRMIVFLLVVAGIAMANPGLSLRAIGAQLEAMRERTPRGGRQWAASSVKMSS